MPRNSKPKKPKVVVDKKIKPKRQLIKKKPVSELSLRALGKNEYRTKFYGLQILESIFNGRNTRGVLPSRVYSSPENFSLSDFPDNQQGRMIIRTDPVRKNQTQTMEEWMSMPRLNFYLDRQQPHKSEKSIKQWMAKVKKKLPSARFIVHKVRPLADYDLSVQINVNFDEGSVKLSRTDARSDRFRDESDVKTTEFQIDGNGRLRRIIGVTRSIFSEVHNFQIMSAVDSLMRVSRETNHKVFESSCVIYKDNPRYLEFYDLIFGKQY